MVTLDGRPERLIIRRDDDDPRPAAGRAAGRPGGEHRAGAGDRLPRSGAGGRGDPAFPPDARPVRGQALEVEIRSEPRRGKLAVARALGPAEGGPRLIAPAPDVAEQLPALVARRTPVEGPRGARDR